MSQSIGRPPAPDFSESSTGRRSAWPGDDFLVRLAFWWSVGVWLVDECLARWLGGPSPYGSLIGGSPLAITGLAGGAVALVVLLPRLRTRAVNPWRAIQLAALIPLGVTAGTFGLWLTTRMRPDTYDAALLAVDQTLRLHAAAWAGQLLRDQPMIRAACYVVYAALPTVMAGALACDLAQFTGVDTSGAVRRPRLILAYLIIGIAGIPLYVTVPAAGPVHAFGSAFPSALPDAFTLTLVPAPWAPEAPRNCMPSIHFAWALVLWRAVTRAGPVVRWAAAGFAMLTALATLGSGEHYLVDLVVAVPFTVAVLALVTFGDAAGSWTPSRRRAFIGGTALTAAWFLLLRSGPAPLLLLHRAPALAWALTIVTVAASVALDGMRERGHAIRES